MKIIHAIFSFLTGGAETMLVDIMNQQCQETSVSLIIVNNKINTDLLKNIDAKVNVFLLNRKAGSKLHLFKTFYKINKIVRRIQPDVIHCHDNMLFPFFIRWKQKTCITVHSINASTRFLNHYAKVFAVSASVQEDIRKYTEVHATVIYNGIEVEQYKSRNDYEFDPTKETFHLIQISRLALELKGQDIAIQAIHLLKKQHPNLKINLYFVGEGESSAELQALVTELNLQNHILFLGSVDRNWVKNNLQNYHLLIQPSRFEGFGLTVIEGFACGLPVITSDLDGPKEIVDLLNSGALVEPNNPADLAQKIQQIYEGYVSNLIKNSRYLILDKNRLKIFDIQTTAKCYLNNYISNN
ncbi:MAG: putative poly(glycerol-phosphate) alpha-glucosyltransferase [Candidatus Ordinivivax streblomastigis]|uniref:Putative poly(Glycerol-phosphate) alpha-glucosyltransferase n=1 Tax=Candidatus Ordinivivax streblomastigis TaxID=2540710 RepID=A0A5M8P1Q3_9BACT|nr:MAG: putative poly(glycerol-phosphate) alpha-glucosyltransferase [Candidatus Ordinivivax streblomastigis]